MRKVSRKYLSRRSLVLLAAGGALACSGDGGTEPAALVVTSASASVIQGGSASVVVTLTASATPAGVVSLTISTPPEGVTATVSDLETSGLITTATVAITVAAETVPGVYVLDLLGTAPGAASGAGLLSLTVIAMPDPADCPAAGACEQWAVLARASTQYSDGEWNAHQATGYPDAAGVCADDPRAWASAFPNTVDWLEVEYAVAVQPTGIRVYEVWGVSSIVKVEVRDDAGTYYTVYTAQPAEHTCPRELSIPVTGVSAKVSVVRIHIDQRTLGDWNEIDAVRLIGTR